MSQFDEMEPPDEWIDYELGSLISIRDELMDGDLRALYIVWLAAQHTMGSYDEEENYEVSVPPVPPVFGTLTAAQQELAELLQTQQELLAAVARHTNTATAPSTDNNIAAWVKSQPPDRRDEYLVRLAHNEPGLSRQFVRELRELNQDKTGAVVPTGKRVTYAKLLTESKALKARWKREEHEWRQAAHQLRLQDIHDHQNDYWHQVDQAAARGSGAGYE